MQGAGTPQVNPVSAFAKATRLKPPKRGKAPFEDGELERLWTQLGNVDEDEECVYLYACRFSAPRRAYASANR